MLPLCCLENPSLAVLASFKIDAVHAKFLCIVEKCKNHSQTVSGWEVFHSTVLSWAQVTLTYISSVRGAIANLVFKVSLGSSVILLGEKLKQSSKQWAGNVKI